MLSLKGGRQVLRCAPRQLQVPTRHRFLVAALNVFACRSYYYSLSSILMFFLASFTLDMLVVPQLASRRPLLLRQASLS